MLDAQHFSCILVNLQCIVCCALNQRFFNMWLRDGSLIMLYMLIYIYMYYTVTILTLFIFIFTLCTNTYAIYSRTPLETGNYKQFIQINYHLSLCHTPLWKITWLFSIKKKKKSYIQNSSAIVCGVLFTPPFSKQAGALDAYMPRNSGIMKPHERKGDGALNYVYLNVCTRRCV